MTLLMTGWMFSCMGLYYKEIHTFFIGIFLVLLNLWCIRTQFMVTTEQYILGMIPHHSMAIFMSKKIKDSKMKEFVTTIIRTQESEIEYMKYMIKSRKRCKANVNIDRYT